MLDQLTFDRSEEIADVLNDQAGLERTLISYLTGRLKPEDELVVFALIHGMKHCRNIALHCASGIATAGKEPDG